MERETSLIFPDPLKRVTFPVDPKVKNAAAGNYHLTQTGDLLRRAFQYSGMVDDLIDDYNQFISQVIPETITSTRIPIVTQGLKEYLNQNKVKSTDINEIGIIQTDPYRHREIYLTFSDVKVEAPVRNGRPYYPYQARRNADSYMGYLKVKPELLVVDYGSGFRREFPVGPKRDDFQSGFVTLGRIPVMTGSQIDNITQIYPKERRANYGEDPRDPMGQFIINGKYNAIFIRDGLRLNRIFNYYHQGAKISSIINMSATNNRPVTLYQSKFGEIYIVIESLKPKKIQETKDEEIKSHSNYLNVVTFARFIFGVTQKEFMDLLTLFTKAKNYRMVKNHFKLTLIRDQKEEPFKLISMLFGDYSSKNSLSQNRFLREKYLHVFDQQFYAHISRKPWSQEKKMDKKKYLLVMQVAKYLEYLLDLREGDDRDSWFNKAMMAPSNTIRQQFNSVWNQIISNLSDNLSKEFERTTFDQGKVGSAQNLSKYRILLSNARKMIESFDTQSKVSLRKRYEEAFNRKSWGPNRTETDDGRSEQINFGITLLELYAIIGKINNPSPDKNPNIKLRMIKRDGVGYEDIVFSPEGNKCGLRTQRGSTARISLTRDDGEIIRDIITSDYYSKSAQPFTSMTACLVNGIFIGWCQGDSIRDLVKHKKRMREYAFDVSVVYDRDDQTIYIHSDDSRPVRPLLVVEENELGESELLIDRHQMWDQPFEKLLEKGIVEYVDAWELRDAVVASRVEEVRSHRRKVKKVKNHLDYLTETYRRVFGNHSRLSQLSNEEIIKSLLQKLEERRDEIENQVKPLQAKRDQIKNQITREEADLRRMTQELSLEELKERVIQQYPLSESDQVKIRRARTPIFIERVIDLRFFSPEYDRIRVLENKISILNQDLRLTRRNQLRHHDYNQVNANKMIDSSVKGFRDHIITPLKEIRKSFDHSYTQQLSILAPVYRRISETSKLFQMIFDYEGQLIINEADLDKKQDYYSTLLQLIQEAVDLVMVISNHNNKLRFILAKRYLNKTRINLLAFLGSLEETLTQIEDYLEEKREEIQEIKIPENTLKVSNQEDYRKYLLEQIDLAKNEYQNVLAEKYHYSELDPNAIFGISASFLPLPNHNDNVRNAYATVQSKQALTGISKVDLVRFSDKAKRLTYSERPIVEPQFNRLVGLDNKGYGQMALTAVLDWGWNREDSVILRKKSVKRGMFQFVSFKTHSLDLSKEKGEGENVKYTFGVPRIAKNDRIYANINEDGLPKVGSYIRVGDVIISSYVTVYARGKIKSYDNNRLVARIGDQGIVDMAQISTNSKGVPVAKVRIRNIRPPEEGDKLSTRSAQKAIISSIMEDEDLPRTRDLGLIPDIIINPLAFPSRMTINHLIESIASLHGVLKGQRQDASGFRKVNPRQYQRTLLKYNFAPNGKFKFVYGKNNTPIDGEVYFGPNYWLALSHHVEDKIQSTTDPARDPRTRRPLGGKKSGGGQKTGEMERDALLSHGAFQIIAERTCVSGGGVEAVWCRRCGIPATPKAEDILRGESIFQCQTCHTRKKEDLGRCSVPYAFLNFRSVLSANGISLKLDFKEKK